MVLKQNRDPQRFCNDKTEENRESRPTWEQAKAHEGSLRISR